ncbi:MAG: hydantoinase/oxoprolinase family protein, partial [Candidatus Hodarchaeota archaeon]
AVDIGGTSTDIALVRNGFCNIDPEGASIGGWKTRVKALNMRTIGLAGDSRVWIDKGRILVGPERVVPLSLAAKDFPNLKDKIEKLGTTDFLLAHRIGDESLYGSEKDLYAEILKSQPVTLHELQRSLGGVMTSSLQLIQNYIQRLKEKYIVEGIGLTPTDILHFNGSFTMWDVETARTGIVNFASNLKISPKELEDRVLSSFHSNIALEILRALITDELGVEPDCEACFSLMNRSVSGVKGKNFDITLKARLPIIAVGAPVEAYMPKISKSVGAKLIIPKHSEVGNAIGAVSGIVSESVTLEFIQIGSSCLIFGIGEPIKRPIDEGLEYAIKKAGEIAEERAVRAGAESPSLKIEKKRLKIKGRFLPIKLGEIITKEDLDKIEYKSIAFGTEIVVTAFGKPAIGK